MNNAVIYARVSSKDQEAEGFSIPAQLKLLCDYAAQNNYRIVAEFTDIETAKNAGRAQTAKTQDWCALSDYFSNSCISL